VNENFEGSEELKNNLKNEFQLSIVVKKKYRYFGVYKNAL